MEFKRTLFKEEIENIKFDNKKEVNLNLPLTSGLLLIKKGAETIFHVRTRNIAKQIDLLLLNKNDNNNSRLSTLIRDYDRIEYILYKDPFSALVAEKQLKLDNNSVFNDKINHYDNYVYLAFNVDNTPYVSIQEDTTGYDLYIGPFRDKFYLVEIIETFSLYSNTPSCRPYFIDPQLPIRKSVHLTNSTREPCNHGIDNRCIGYCNINNKQDLIKSLSKVYLNLNSSLLKQLKNSWINFENDLEFIKAEKSKKIFRLINSYYSYLRFFTVIKSLNFSLIIDNINYKIQNGLLVETYSADNRQTFVKEEDIFTDYRDNEFLALPKNQFEEMWTVYSKIYKIHPQVINELSTNNKDYLNNLLNKEIK